MDEAISTAKELKDKVGLGHALNWAAGLALLERNRAEVDRLASDLIELSTRTSLLFNLPEGVGKRGWERSTFGNTVEGIPCIEQAIRKYRAAGSVLGLPFYLACKAEAFISSESYP